MTDRTFRILATLTLVALAGCAATPPADEGPPPWFEEVAAQRGLTFEHVSGHDGSTILFPEIIGGGVALFDMDGDADLDVYVVQSGSLHRPGSDAGRNRLFENDGRGTFRDVTAGSGADDRGYGMGVAAGDYDADGDTDLYVTNYGPNVLLRNDGDGRFTDVSAAAGVADPAWGTSAAFLDANGDGLLDIFVANYVNWSAANEQTCYNPAGREDYCLPTNYDAPAVDSLFVNRGDGTFEDAGRRFGLGAAFGNGLGVVAADLDDDGRVDVVVANDTMMNQLWVNHGPDGFVDEGLLRGVALDEHGDAKAGMGTTVGDIDDDGDEDLIIVNLESQTDSFFRNHDGVFIDDTAAVGLTGASRSHTRFGIGLADFDHDGYLDLYQANGRVTASPEPLTEDPYAEPNLLYRGGPEGFVEALPAGGGTARALVHSSRGAAFGDVDGDGAIDIVVVNRDGPAYLLRNLRGTAGAWARLRVVDEHGSDALGAVVSLDLGERRLTRTVRAAFGYCASHDPRVHVGLGAAGGIGNVTVTWPDGTVEVFGDLPPGDTVLRRGSARPA